MKKSFTLFELIISITLLFIITFFLHDFFNNTKLLNKKFENITKNQLGPQNTKNIFIKDFLQSKMLIIEEDKRKNNIVLISTSNSYHNPFFTNITYLISRDKKLIRIESKELFDKKNINKDFLKNSYIDILMNNVEDFKLYKSKKTKKYLMYIQTSKLSYEIPLFIF